MALKGARYRKGEKESAQRRNLNTKDTNAAKAALCDHSTMHHWVMRSQGRLRAEAQRGGLAGIYVDMPSESSGCLQRERMRRHHTGRSIVVLR